MRLAKNMGFYAPQERESISVNKLLDQNLNRPLRLLTGELIVFLVSIYMAFVLYVTSDVNLAASLTNVKLNLVVSFIISYSHTPMSLSRFTVGALALACSHISASQSVSWPVAQP